MSLEDYIHNKPVIETGRLILRPLVSSDIMALKEWMPDKSIYTYWGKGPGKSEKNLGFERFQVCPQSAGLLYPDEV